VSGKVGDDTEQCQYLKSMYLTNQVTSWHKPYSHPPVFVSGLLACKKNWTITTNPNLNHHKNYYHLYPCMNCKSSLFSRDLYCKYVRHFMDL